MHEVKIAFEIVLKAPEKVGTGNLGILALLAAEEGGMLCVANLCACGLFAPAAAAHNHEEGKGCKNDNEQNKPAKRLPITSRRINVHRVFGELAMTCGIALTHHCVNIAAHIQNCLGGGSDEVLIDHVGEKSRKHAQACHNIHGNKHGLWRLLGFSKLHGKLTEENGLACLNKGSKSHNADYHGNYQYKGVTDVARAHGHVVGGVINHPFGHKAVEGRDSGDGKCTYKEKRCGVGHPLGKTAQFVQICSSGGVKHASCNKEQKSFKKGVVHGMVKTAAYAKSTCKTNGGNYIADLGDAVEGKKALEVVLRKSHSDAHEHTDAANNHKHDLHCGHVHCCKNAVHQADYAENAALCEDTGNNDGNRRGGNCVSVRRNGLEGEDKCFCCKAHKKHGKGQNRCGACTLLGKQGGHLTHVQSMKLGIHEYGSDKHKGRADGAHHEVLKRALKSAVFIVSESGKGNGGDGHNFNHNEHVEHVAGHEKAQHAAAEHQKKGVILVHGIVLRGVLEGVEGGKEYGCGNKYAEEKGNSIDFKADADGVAAGGLPAAEPIGKHLTVNHDGLNHGENHEGGA